MNETTKPPPEWCQGTDLDNFVTLLRGLRGSLEEDIRELPDSPAAVLPAGGELEQ